MKPEERWLRGLRRRAHPWPLVGLLCDWGAVLVLALQAWLLAEVVTAVSFHGHPLDEQWPRLGALLALLPLRAALQWGAEQAAAQAEARIKVALRDELFDKIRRLGPAWRVGQQTGDLATRLTQGIEALGGYHRHYLPAQGRLLAVPTSLLAIIAWQDPWSGLILLVTAPLVPFFMILIGKGAERRNLSQWRQLRRMGAHLFDRLRGLVTLKLYNAGRRQRDEVARMAEGYRRRTLSVLRIAFLSSFTLEFFATVSIALVAVIVGFRLYWGELGFFEGFFVLLMAPEFFLPLRTLGGAYHQRMEALGAAEGVLAVFDAPLPPAGGYPFERRHAKGIAIALHGVGFRWPDGRAGLQEIDAQIAAGTRLAIAGPSGAGKSTLMQLLLGFIQPDEGEILVDDQPLSRLDPTCWRRHLAWVPQSPHLFQGTLAENIALGAPHADRRAILAAAEQAHCLDVIDALPQGLETPVGDGGHPLSGGERQRIALARAFLRRAPLVLLDEPTAHLDLTSEALIQRAVDDLAGQATLVTIAHRRASLCNADTIWVLEGGRLVEQGRHQALLRRTGPYARLLGAVP